MPEFAGVLRRDGRRVDYGQLERLLHRLGPAEASGVLLVRELGFVHCRAATDIVTTRQPFQSTDGRLSGTLVGRLSPEPGEPKISDADRLLDAVRQSSSSGLQLFGGRWAVALWDATHGQLVLARGDRGSPPLWCRESEDQLSFATRREVVQPLGDNHQSRWATRCWLLPAGRIRAFGPGVLAEAG